MQAEFSELGFEKCFYSKDMRSIAGHFTQNNRCGVYILHFSNGQYYVGLAIDVVNRYAQHRLNHLDIEYVSFKEAAKSKLPQLERETIFKLENLKKSLRNINIVSVVSGDTDLDLIVSVGEQKNWLTDELQLETLQAKRFDYSELRKKYVTKFQKLLPHPLIEEIKDNLKAYVLAAIPYPLRTEYSFWSVSCLPSTNGNDLVRINIFWQETLVFSEYKLEKDIQADNLKVGIDVMIWVAKSILAKKWTEQTLHKKFKTLQYVDLKHESGGQDQQCLAIESVEFCDFLFTEGILDAAKEFNLRLMRKGGCMWGRYHCFDLADVALDISDLTSQ